MTDVGRLEALTLGHCGVGAKRRSGAIAFLARVAVTRMQHGPIRGDRFRVQHVADELASRVVQLFGSSAPGDHWTTPVTMALIGTQMCCRRLSARKPQREAGRSDGGGHPEDLRCDDGRVFFEVGLASLFEPFLHASGVELQDLAHENDERSNSHESHHCRVLQRLPRLHHLPAASASSVAAVVLATVQPRDVTTKLAHIKSVEALAVALPDFWLDHRWAL